MASVENRIVRMEFDNATFEARIKSTIASLGQLDKALKLEGAHKGLTDISAAANKVDLSPIKTSVQSVSAGFLALSTIAITALAQITAAALRSAAQMSSAFTFKPIIDGFREFELQIGSVQTILANTARDGTNLQQVSAALDELNTFADKTIFNFGQMTRNIGTFTAAGVDLQTSVDSIKGISNLAAISGSSAEQAASAMFQLSQAVATGTLRLIDWNSVVNAGMGGETFQRALFETGKALGTITDASVDTSFEDWTAAGNSFRDSLESGWLTADVLTTTLKGFTGDMTEAQLTAIGFTKEQSAEILAMGQAGLEAATKVRTLTQLMTTLKEALGSGWAQSFRIILGDFEEATQLFTGLSNSIGGFFNRTSEARNAVLQGWADLGGRTQLLQGLENAFFAIGRVLSEIGKAFRDIFPATTAQRLFDLTQGFVEFTEALRPSEQTIANVRRIFTGLFAALDIGWEILKNGVIFIKDLVVQLLGLGQGNFLEGAADILDFFTNLRDSLDGGEKIKEFFDTLTNAVQKPIAFIHELKDIIFEFFDGLAGGAADTAGAGVDRISERFEGLSTVLDRLGGIGDVVKTVLEGILTVLDTVGQAIIDWFQELGQKLADAIGPGEFDAVLDALNVSLLGGIALLIGKFLRGGINFDVGEGMFSKISSAFGELTGVLKAMQTSIRADALLKIAAAVGILAAAMVVLSLIDSAALTRALVAMAVGFTQLMAAFAILNTMSVGISSGASFTIIAAGMILLSVAVLILAGAVAILAQLDWGELARGLTGITVALGVLTAAAILISRNSGSLITAGIGITAMAIALNILALAVKSFAEMNWTDMARGFAGVTAGLLIIAGAMHLMPSNMLVTGAGLILVATALNILALALKSFAEMEWGEMVRGFAGIAGGLLIIAGAMHLMPANLPITAAGLILVGIALNLIAKALESFGGMSWSEIARGLAGLAGALLILAVATNAMSGALAGAAAILVVSIALGVLAHVLTEVAKIPFGDLIKAIGGIAIALAVFGIAAALLQPVVPALLGLGVAMLFLGGAFALFGVGALAVAKAFQIVAEAGPEAAQAVLATLQAIGAAIPALLIGLAQGILDFIQVFLDAAPVIAEALGVLLLHVAETLIQLTPKFGELMLALIDMMINVVTVAGPRLIQAGIDLLLNFLTGIRNNITAIVNLVSDIVVAFLNAVAAKANEIVTAGLGVLVAFLQGITDNMHKVVEAVGTMITTFINACANEANRIVTAGANAIISFVTGIGNNIQKVVTAGVDVVIALMNSISDNAIRLAEAAADCLITFLNELAAVIREKSGELRQAGKNIAFAIADGMTLGLASKARDVANKAVDMAQGALGAVGNFLGIGSPSKKFIEIGEWMGEGMAIGLKDTRAVEKSAENMANTAVSAMRLVLGSIADEMSMVTDMTPTITPVLDTTQIRDEAQRIAGYISDVASVVSPETFGTAQLIATSPTPRQTALDVAPAESKAGVSFEQNIYAPEQLSTADIYKQTRNQITLAKEELDVP